MLAIKRESFRVEIRKQKLEQRFNTNRQIIKGDETMNNILKSKSAKNTLNLDEEQKQVLKNSLLICIQQMDCETTMILKQLNKIINGVTIDIKIYLLDLDILNTLIQLKLNDDEVNIILIYGMTLVKQLIDDQYIIRQIMSQKKLRDQLVQYFSYLTNHIQDTNREIYWRLMEVFQQNTMHYYSIQRNILQINLEEIVINQDEQLETYQLQLIIVILTVFKSKIETEFSLLFHYKKYDSTPYQALLEILRNENTEYEILQIVVRILILLIQNTKADKLLLQIISPSLYTIIQNMLYRNEEVQLIGLRLISTIIKTELFSTVEHKIELLRKLYMFACVKVKLEILKLFYDILSKNRLHLLANKLIEQNVTQLLYDCLHQDLYNEIVILGLKCLYHTFHKLPTHQLRQILYDQNQMHDQLSKLINSQNEMISKLAELILDTFIVNI